MSTTVPFFIDPALGFTLGSNVRNILDANGNPVRIELKPLSPFAADPEFETTQSGSGAGSMGNWTILNTANAGTIDGNTTLKSRLVIIGNGNICDWVGATETGPFVYQLISGDFDVFTRVGINNDAISGSPCGVRLHAQDSISTTIFWSLLYAPPRATADILWEHDSGATLNFTGIVITDKPVVGDPIYFRVKRASGVFTAYYSTVDTFPTWTQISQPGTTYTSTNDVRLGIAATQDLANKLYATADFLRTWPPYDTTSPTASYILDSGASGTTWTMSTFQDYLNQRGEFDPYEQIGFGTLKYQYGASDSSPPSLNGSWLSTASMQAQSNPSGRYFKLSVQFNSADGWELCRFNGAYISAAIAGGGGGGGGSILQSSIIQGLGAI